MIFVCVGNWPKGFDRLINEVDRLVGQNIITEKVVMQIGGGSYHPLHTEWFDYCSPERCEELIHQSQTVVSHAGIGTIATALRYGKPIVVMPRKSNLIEAFDNHQFSTAKEFEREGKLLVAYKTEEIAEKIKQSYHFMPRVSETSDELFNAIKNYIDKLEKEKEMQ